MPPLYLQSRTDLPNGTTLVEGKCSETRQMHSILVPTAGLERWLAGEVIQKAMPGVSAEDREFLVTGYSPAGWAIVFGDEDEEDDDDA